MSDLDITLLILSEHDAFRRGFTEIDSLTDPTDLATKWRELSDSLEVHASGEEDVFYPQLLRRVDDSKEDTEDAIKDHNKIRDAVHADHPLHRPGEWGSGAGLPGTAAGLAAELHIQLDGKVGALQGPTQISQCSVSIRKGIG